MEREAIGKKLVRQAWMHRTMYLGLRGGSEMPSGPGGADRRSHGYYQIHYILPGSYSIGFGDTDCFRRLRGIENLRSGGTWTIRKEGLLGPSFI